MDVIQTTRTIKAAVAVAMFGALALPTQADELFSRQPLHPVIESPQQVSPPTTQPQQRPQQRPATPSQPADMSRIVGLLKQSGYSVQDLGKGILGLKVKSGTLTIPMLVSLSPDKSNIWLIMILKTVASTAEMTPNRLMGLMEANQKYGPAFFTFSRQTKQIQLRRAVTNRNLDAAGLKLQVDVMALVVAETESLWSGDTKVSQAPSKAPVKKTTPQRTTPTTSREVGRWVVQLKSGEGFELRLNADGSFVLVHRKPDRTSETSQGRYTLNQGKLTLNVTGQPALVGQVSFSGNNAFQFVIGNGGGLYFQRA